MASSERTKKLKEYEVALLGNANNLHFKRFIQLLSVSDKSFLVISDKNNDQKLDDYLELPFKGKLGYFLNAFWLRDRVRSGKLSAKILNAHYANGYGLIAALSGHRKIILSLWGSDVLVFPRKSILHKLLLKFILSRGHKVSATSKNMINAASKYAPRKEYLHTPFGVESRFYYSRRYSQNKDWINIGLAKSIELIYGHDTLLRSFKMLKNMYMDNCVPFNVQLHIGGEGVDQDAMRSLCNELDLQNDVKFVGYIPHPAMPKFLQEIDVFVSLSRSESYGVASLEAAASGLPLLLSKTLGSCELFRNEKVKVFVQNVRHLKLT